MSHSIHSHSLTKILGAIERIHLNVMQALGYFVVLALSVLQAHAACKPAEFLISMEKKELIDVVSCVAKSKSPILCSKFAACEKLMAPRVLFALDECKKEIVPEGIKRCTPYSVVFETKEIPEKIFDCTVEKVEKLNFAEKKIMLNFEECTKILFEEDCKGKKF